MKILVTGFDPFGGEEVNPALEAVKQLPKIISGAEIITLEIPTVFGDSVKKIQSWVEKENPDVVVSVGQAGGRFTMCPERVAINIDDARIPDNQGNQPLDIPVVPHGPNAYFSNLPVKAMVQKMKENGIPATLSNTAGTFVCNHVMFGVLHMIHTKYPNMKGGFIHVPYVTNQVVHKGNTPSFSLEEITKGLIFCLEAIVENPEDIRVVGGEIS